MKHTITLLLITLFAKFNSFAQAPAIQWQQSFGGSLNDDGRSVDFTSDGGYIMAGSTSSSDGNVSLNHGGTDFWLVKTNSTGILQWQTSLGGTSDDSAYTVKHTGDGGYIVAGWTKSNDGDVSGNKGNKDWWIVKLNSGGNVTQWQKTYGGSGDDEARYIEQTADGGYIAVGSTLSNDSDVTGNHGGSDVWVVKTDGSGNIQWQKTLGGSLTDIGNRIHQTPDGGYIISASTGSNDGNVSGNHGRTDIWIVKLNSSGTIIEWSRTYGGSFNDRGGSVIMTTDSGYIVTGSTSSNDGDVSVNQGLQDAWVLKLDSIGAIQWQRTLGGTLRDRAGSVVQTSDGGYVILANTESADGDVTGNHGGWDLWLVKLNSTGSAIEWQQTFGGTADDLGHSALLLPAGGFIIAGVSGSNNGDVTGNNGMNDFWLAKLLFHCPAGTVTANLTGDSTICVGTQVPLVLTFTGTAPWTFSINGSSPQMTSNNPDTIFVSPGSTTSYNLSYAFDAVCVDSGLVSGSATVSVSTSPPLWNLAISASKLKACSGTVQLFTSNVVGGQNIHYRWSAPAGSLFSNNSGGPFSAGPFENMLPQVYVQFGPLQGSSGYTVCVEAFNGCGTTNNNCIWIRGVVSGPAPIAGSSVACSNDTKPYSVPVPGGADTLLWTFSVPGATFTPTSPQGNQVTINFPVFTSGQLCVSGALYCLGSSTSAPRCMTITNAPTIPSPITGPSAVCGGNTFTYSILPDPGAINYTWTAKPGILFNASPSPYTTGATSVSVSFPPGYIAAGNLCVTANSSCAASNNRCKAVYSLIPATPGNISASPLSWCSGGTVAFSVVPVSGATAYNWIVSNGTITNGQGTNSISVTWATGIGTVYVRSSNSCGQSSPKSQAFSSTCRESGDILLADMLQVFPNPAHDKITVSFNNNADSKYYSLTLSDITGRIVFSQNNPAVAGNNTKEINLYGLSRGVYFVQIRSMEKTMVSKISIE